MEKIYSDITLDREKFRTDEEFDLALGKLLHQLADLDSEIRLVYDDVNIYWIQYNQNQHDLKELGYHKLVWLSPEDEELLNSVKEFDDAEEQECN